MKDWYFKEGWDDSAVPPYEAAKWRMLVGPEPLTAESWCDVGFTPDEAEPWIKSNYEFSPTEAMNYSSRGLSPERAISLIGG